MVPPSVDAQGGHHLREARRSRSWCEVAARGTLVSRVTARIPTLVSASPLSLFSGPGGARPFAVAYALTKDGDAVHAVTIVDRVVQLNEAWATPRGGAGWGNHKKNIEDLETKTIRCPSSFLSNPRSDTRLFSRFRPTVNLKNIVRYSDRGSVRDGRQGVVQPTEELFQRAIELDGVFAAHGCAWRGVKYFVSRGQRWRMEVHHRLQVPTSGAYLVVKHKLTPARCISTRSQLRQIFPKS